MITYTQRCVVKCCSLQFGCIFHQYFKFYIWELFHGWNVVVESFKLFCPVHLKITLMSSLAIDVKNFSKLPLSGDSQIAYLLSSRCTFIPSHNVLSTPLTEERRRRCVIILSVLQSIGIMLQPISWNRRYSTY